MHWLVAKFLAERRSNRNLAFLANTGVGDMLAYELAKISRGFIIDSMTFKYRRKITITEQSGNNLSDYQVRIDLDATNFDFSHFLNEGKDLRFTDASGNLLPYWVEKMDIAVQEATIWVKVPSIPANSSVDIYVYYGSSEVESASNGDDVFEFFDYFGQQDALKAIWNSDVIATGPFQDTARNIIIDDDILYAVSRSPETLVVYDVSDPSNPSRLALVDTGYEMIDIRKKGDYLLISSNGGLLVYDVSDPTNPQYITRADIGFGHGTYLEGDYLYYCMHLVDKFKIVDVSDPSNPVLLSTLEGATYFDGAHDVYVDPTTNLAYVSNYQATTDEYGLTVVDVSDPTDPSVVTGVAEATKLSGIYRVGDYLYVGSHDPESGLYIFDISTPTAPSLVKQWLPGANSMGYWIDQIDSNTLAMVSGSVNKLWIVDISTPDDPTVKACAYSPVFNVKNVCVNGEVIFVSWNHETTYEWYISCFKYTDVGSIDATKWEVVKKGDTDVGNGVFSNAGPTYNGAGLVSMNSLPIDNYIIEALVKRERGKKAGEPGAIVGFTDKTSRDTTYYGCYLVRADGEIFENSSYDYRLMSRYDDAVVRGSSDNIPEWDNLWIRVKTEYFHADKATKTTFVYPDGSGYVLGPTAAGTKQLSAIYIQIYYAEWVGSGNSVLFDWVFVRKYASVEPSVSVGAEESA